MPHLFELEYFPASALLQEEEPDVDHSPVAHELHPVESGFEYWPHTQLAHFAEESWKEEEEAASEMYLPLGQLVQLDWPAFENCGSALVKNQ